MRNQIISNLVRDYGMLGHFVAEMINMLPFIGVALGIIMIYWLFPDVVGDKKNSFEKQDRS